MGRAGQIYQEQTLTLQAGQGPSAATSGPVFCPAGTELTITMAPSGACTVDYNNDNATNNYNGTAIWILAALTFVASSTPQKIYVDTWIRINCSAGVLFANINPSGNSVVSPQNPFTVGSGGGVTSFAALTDASTAAIPTTNTPTAAALATLTAAAATAQATANAAVPALAAVGITGAIAVTHSAYSNRPLNSTGTTTATFAATATSGAVDGDRVQVKVVSGTFTASGTITAPSGYKLTANPGEVFQALYDLASDSYTSATPSGAVSAVTTTQGTNRNFATTDNGQRIQPTANITLTMPLAIGGAAFACDIVFKPGTSFTVTIASSGGALLNGATASLTRTSTLNQVFSIVGMADVADSYEITGS